MCRAIDRQGRLFAAITWGHFHLCFEVSRRRDGKQHAISDCPADARFGEEPSGEYGLYKNKDVC